MRTKALLLAAAVTAAGIAATQAQSNVYSVNVVGYYNITVPTGGPQNNVNRFRLATLQLKANGIANPTLNNSLTNVPAGTQVHIWGVGGFSGAIEFLGAPDLWETDAPIPYGTGFFIKNPTAADITVTVVGEVMQGSLTNSWPAGYSPRGSLVPQAGGLTDDLKFTQAGEKVYSWQPGWGGLNEYLGGVDGWELGQPTNAVGQAVMISSTAGGEWVRNFTVQ